MDGAGLFYLSVGIKNFSERAPTAGFLGENETALRFLGWENFALGKWLFGHG